MNDLKKLRKDVIESMGRLAIQGGITLHALDQYSKLLEDLQALHSDNVRIYADLTDINISMNGDKKMLNRAFTILRAAGFEPTVRPEDGQTEYTSRWTKQGDRATLYLLYYSTVCKRVQVGTRTVQEPVYEIQCSDEVDESLAGSAAEVTPAPCEDAFQGNQI